MTDGRTLFRKSVVSAADSPRLLIPGENQRKLGSHVVKGPWKGMPIYALTLEERATCPKSCHHWRSCYGNNMPFARRHELGPDLEEGIVREVRALAAKHPGGFVVRLHVLGDFYSPTYARVWEQMLWAHAALHIFGYTGRPRDSVIGQAISAMNRESGGRCVIRFSTPDGGPMTATTIERPGIVCPVQTGRTDCCGTCGLCWSPAMRDKAIIFLDHGRPHDWREGEMDLKGKKP
ncbi:MAG: hypothetical protein KGL35_13545 [Bradyrhizobium sp.]|nr:hypothetical protein [Bradyrhizobium sp.]